MGQSEANSGGEVNSSTQPSAGGLY